MKRFWRLPLTILCLSALVAHPALAYDSNYNTQNNIIFQDDPNAVSCLTTGGSTSFPPTTAKVEGQTLQRIKDLQATYEQAASQTKVPWQVYAAIDYREDNNDPNKGILGGEVIGTPATDSGKISSSKLESIVGKNGGFEHLRDLAKAAYQVDVTKPMTFEQLQQAFVSYNRGRTYVHAHVSPDLSPYVMSNYDEAHKNMVYPDIPPDPSIGDKGETLHGKDTRLGAMAVYANIATLGTGSCVGAGVGAKVNYTGLYPDLPAGTLPDNLLCTPRPSTPSFKLLKGPACDSFIALNSAYQQTFGQQMPLSGGYRTAQQQIACGGTRAHPGGSNPRCIYYDPNNDPPEHLWGTAIDFSGPLQYKTTREHQWLVQNGPTFGWFWPRWASGGHGGNAGVEEDWHFAYYFVGHDPNRLDKNGRFIGDTLESYK